MREMTPTVLISIKVTIRTGNYFAKLHYFNNKRIEQ